MRAAFGRRSIIWPLAFGNTVILKGSEQSPRVHGEIVRALVDAGAPEGDAEAFLKPSTVHDSFAQDLSEADRWLIVASQRPIALGANTAATQTAAWKTIPSTYIVCDRDNAIPPAGQEFFASRLQRVHHLDAGHGPFLSRPDELATLIRAELEA